MGAPDLGDTAYDPASGTAGFLIDVVDHVLARYSEEPEEVPDEDPAELMREVLAIKREITAGLEKLLSEVER